MTEMLWGMDMFAPGARYLQGTIGQHFQELGLLDLVCVIRRGSPGLPTRVILWI